MVVYELLTPCVSFNVNTSIDFIINTHTNNILYLEDTISSNWPTLIAKKDSDWSNFEGKI